MKRFLVAAVCAVAATTAMAELRDEEHVVGNTLVKIAVVDSLEIMTVGPSDHEQMQVLSGADVEIVAFAGDPENVALLGKPVLVAEVVGTQSCEEGDAREYYVVTLGDVPVPDGPVTTCQELTATVTSGLITLEADPMSDDGEFWAWAPDKGWGDQLN